mgnify:CR=1 FL=1
MRRALWVGLTAAAVLAADQASKSWAVTRLSSGRTIDVAGGLQFRLAFNTGMAWSNFEGGGPVIALISLVIVGSLAWFARSVRSPVGLVIIGAVIGGARGNVATRGDQTTMPILPSMFYPYQHSQRNILPLGVNGKGDDCPRRILFFSSPTHRSSRPIARMRKDR